MEWIVCAQVVTSCRHRLGRSGVAGGDACRVPCFGVETVHRDAYGHFVVKKTYNRVDRGEVCDLETHGSYMVQETNYTSRPSGLDHFRETVGSTYPPVQTRGEQLLMHALLPHRLSSGAVSRPAFQARPSLTGLCVASLGAAALMSGTARQREVKRPWGGADLTPSHASVPVSDGTQPNPRHQSLMGFGFYIKSSSPPHAPHCPSDAEV